MGKKTVSLFTLAAVAALLAGCGPPMAWQKPGTTMAEAQADGRECNLLARNQAFRESFFGPPYATYPGYYAFGGYPYVPYGPYGYRRGYHDSFMWRGQRESDLQDFCLRSKGYSLQAVPQAEQQ